MIESDPVNNNKAMYMLKLTTGTEMRAIVLNPRLSHSFSLCSVLSIRPASRKIQHRNSSNRQMTTERERVKERKIKRERARK